MGCGRPAAGDAIVSTDPTAITTELPATAEMPAGSLGAAAPAGSLGAAVPAGSAAAPVLVAPTAPVAGAPTEPVPTAATESTAAAGVEPCPHCGTALALDQRYCLECGAPRTYLSGMLLERLRSESTQPSPTQPLQPPPLGGVAAVGTQPSPSPSAWQRGNVLALIAGVGVLLLAMGVGVLIGRSGSSGSSASPAPQVISVGGAATGAASTSTTPTTPAETSTTKSGSGSSQSTHKSGSSGVGSSPSKPAPPTVLKNLRTGSGQSYEQKSKNLPNVVSTG